MSSNISGHALPLGFELQCYKIHAVLGQGGFGITYLATDNNLKRKVAVKEFMPAEFVTRDQTDRSVKPLSKNTEEMFEWGLKRFRREARTLAKFKHPNIVQVLSLFDLNNTAYMVMEYEQGKEFGALLEQNKALSEEALLRVVLPIIDGLEKIHLAGFIHRDIKPSNIYVRSDQSPVLLDFGSARQRLSSATQSLTSLVTHGYAPFEQYSTHNQANQQGPWTDIYAMGATLYYAIAAEKPCDAMHRAMERSNGRDDPYKSITHFEAAANFSSAFLQAIDAALCFKSEDRPQSVAEWSKMLTGNAATTLHNKSTSKKNSRSDNDKTRIVEHKQKPNQALDATSHNNLASKLTAEPANRKTTNATNIYAAALILLIVVVVGLSIFLIKDEPSNPVAPEAKQKKPEDTLADVDEQQVLVSPTPPIETEEKTDDNQKQIAEYTEQLAKLKIREISPPLKIKARYDIYQQILKIEAGHKETINGIAAMHQEVAANIRQNITDNNFETARVNLALLKAIKGSDEVVEFLDKETLETEARDREINRQREAERILAQQEELKRLAREKQELKKNSESKPSQLSPRFADAITLIEKFKNTFEQRDLVAIKRLGRTSANSSTFAKRLFAEYEQIKTEILDINHIKSENLVEVRLKIISLVNRNKQIVSPAKNWESIQFSTRFDKDKGWAIDW